MSVEIFSQEQFEKALPQGYWKYAGFLNGEHSYLIPITDDILIMVRSSVDSSGYSADTGEDSIRAWLVRSDGSPLGSKVSKWTNRVPGWEERLLNVLRQLWEMAHRSGYCYKCGQPKGIYRVVKKGPNKGKLFAKCDKCNTFDWLE